MSSLSPLKGFFISFLLGNLAMAMPSTSSWARMRVPLQVFGFCSFCLAWFSGGCLSEFFSRGMPSGRECSASLTTKQHSYSAVLTRSGKDIGYRVHLNYSYSKPLSGYSWLTPQSVGRCQARVSRHSIKT